MKRDRCQTPLQLFISLQQICHVRWSQRLAHYIIQLFFLQVRMLKKLACFGSDMSSLSVFLLSTQPTQKQAFVHYKQMNETDRESEREWAKVKLKLKLDFGVLLPNYTESFKALRITLVKRMWQTSHNARLTQSARLQSWKMLSSMMEMIWDYFLNVSKYLMKSAALFQPSSFLLCQYLYILFTYINLLIVLQLSHVKQKHMKEMPDNHHLQAAGILCFLMCNKWTWALHF